MSCPLKNSESKNKKCKTRKLNSYSPHLKTAVINAVKEAGDAANKGDIAKKFGIPASTLSTFLATEKSIQGRIDVGDMSRKRKKGVEYPEIEETMIVF